MSKGSVNKVILLGNLGQDPEMRAMTSGDSVANFSIATTESWKDKNTGEQKERTEWHRLVAFRKLADIAERYLHKGDKVYIEGRLQTRKWQDSNGQDRYTTEILVDQLQMLTPKGGSQAEDRPPARVAPSSQADIDDDIPF